MEPQTADSYGCGCAILTSVLPVEIQKPKSNIPDEKRLIHHDPRENYDN
jgi:hypothetical protein